MKKFKPASRDNQKLIYALFQSYAAYLSTKKPNSLPKAYWAWKAKGELKILYMEATKEIRCDNALDKLKDNTRATIEIVIEKNISTDNKIEIILDDIMLSLRVFISDLAVELGSTETFSLTLKLCGNERAIAFTQFIIDYYLDNEIAMTEKTIEMIKEQEHDKFVYAMLRNKKCAVCGTVYNVDFEHWKTAGSLGGYKHDKGQGLYISLCRNHHTEKHDIGILDFYAKYQVKGIVLNDTQIIELKKIYKNQLKAYVENDV